MNVDIGGGTSKIAVCAEGKVIDLTAVDVGARLVCLDDAARVVRIEEAGRRFAAELGVPLEIGAPLGAEAARKLAALMADRLFAAMQGNNPTADGAELCRLDPLSRGHRIDQVTFSGGVAEYIYEREAGTFGDLGVLLAQEIRARVASWGPTLEPSNEGIRATVIGASQYTTQVSGSTIYVSPMEALPLRNVPVIAPALPIEGETIDAVEVAAAIKGVLKRLELDDGHTPVAVFVPWQGSATFQRLDALCKGIVAGLSAVIENGHPIVLAGDGDVGGLIGIHLHEEMKIGSAVVSIDGLELKDFDYVDIGTMLPASGAVPVVIKSLIFPTSAGTGKDWQAAPRSIGKVAAAAG
jgi:ethanolamine utilization protein EutA